MKQKLIFVLMGVMLLVILAGCSTKTEENKAAAPIPSKEAPQEFTDVPNAGDDWESLKIQVVEISSKKITDYTVKINGDYVNIAKTNLKIKIEQFIPDFYMSGQKRIGSKSKELNNPAALIVVAEEGKVEPFRGWIFSKYPDIHKGPSDKYSFRLVDLNKKKN
ncbi:hypothetical protein HY745_03895 [Candidatus Desantisbacteria bacterium]|nr:hypothetical protein [Candidatus Desantisbacteria bacterium]